MTLILVIAIFTDSFRSYAYQEEIDSGTINNKNKTADLTIKMSYFLCITDSWIPSQFLCKEQK